MLVHLRAIGSITDAATEGDTPEAIEREALLVYAGDFQSMDGPVTVTPEQIKLLIARHNATLAKLTRLATGQVPLKHYPPVQLDHSRSGWDTVGRVVGELREGTHRPEGSEDEVPAVFGRVRFLGRENVERVKDGRWTHLSCGADFGEGKLSELSVTPFPAAANASLLGKKDPAQADQKHAEGESQAQTTRMGSMDKAKLKRYLTEHKKMSEKDADEHLSKLEGKEHEDEMKKLALEFDEWAKEEEKEHEKKMAGRREKLTQLSAGFKSNVSAARLSTNAAKIGARLSKLRAEAKITPAEAKKLNIVELAAKPDAEIEAVLKTYNDREPVIHTGQLGTVKGADLSKLGGDGDRQARMAAIEEESRKRLGLTKPGDQKAAKSFTERRLAEGRTEEPVQKPEAKDKDEDHLASLDKEHAELSAMFSEGRHGEAKERLKAYMAKCLAMSRAGAGPGGDYPESSAAETENQLTALTETVTKLQAQFEELAQITTEALAPRG